MALVEAFRYAVELDLIDQIKENFQYANGRTAKKVIGFIEALRNEVASVAPELEAVHASLARGAQDATVAAYDAAIAVRNTPPYRMHPNDPRNRRFAGGALRSALVDPSFAVATEEGIIFGNTQLMDRRARQWHRLNYGAGDAAPSPDFPVRWSNLVVATLGLDDGPSPAFRLYPGFWINGAGGVAEFYPVGEEPDEIRNERPRRRPTRPRNNVTIEAQRWLDAGVEYIAYNLTREYEQLYRNLFSAAGRTAQTEDVARPRSPARQRRLGFLALRRAMG